MVCLEVNFGQILSFSCGVLSLRKQIELQFEEDLKEIFLKQHKPGKDTFCFFNFLQVSSGITLGAPFSEKS